MEKRYVELMEEIKQLINEINVEKFLSNIKVKDAVRILSDGIGMNQIPRGGKA